jgi:hypothetical protein
MEHIAIDLGSRESQVCVRSAAGEISAECRWRTDRLVAFLEARPPARVILETCTRPFESQRWHSALDMTCELSRRSCGLLAWGVEGSRTTSVTREC